MGGHPWQATLYGYMCGALSPPLWGHLGLMPLWLGSWLYRGLVRGDRGSYSWRLRRCQRLPCRVISIGNLTLGGTGKTSLTIWAARWLQQQGWRVAVLSRGYGRRPGTTLGVVSTGAGPLLPWSEVGDEPYLMAQALPGIAVLVGNDRYVSGCYAYEQLEAQVLLLDDGFQHYRLARDLDMVLIDVTNPFGHGTLLPRGILREPLHALERADAVVLTRTELARAALPEVVAQIRAWNTRVPIYAMQTIVQAVCQGETLVDPDLVLRQRRVVAFAGIGNPQAFAMTLAQLGAEVAALLVFPDHHPYTAQDWQRILAIAERHNAACLVTTAKDAVRLSAAWHAPIPLYTLCIDVVFPDDAEGLQQQLKALMRHADDCG